MIKILHLITSLGASGGAEQNLVRLVCAMDRRRFSNSVVTIADAPLLPRRLADAGVPYYSLGITPGVPNPIAITRLLGIIRKTSPDILQTWMYHADLLGLLVGKLARVPTIVWNVRSSFMDLAQYGFLSSLVLRALVTLSPLPDAVIVNSHSGVRSHEALGYAPRKWILMFNSLDLTRFRPDAEARVQLRRELGLPVDSMLIGLVARFDPMKDHRTFVTAAGLLAKSDPALRFVLVGWKVDAQNTSLMQMIRDTGAPDRFHLLGLRQNVERITAGLDIACSSSVCEGSSNTIGEAMGCGVPCVVTDVGDSAFLVGETGKVVHPQDSEKFSRACREVLDLSPEQRRQLGLRARARVRVRYSLPSIVARYQDLYSELGRGSSALDDSSNDHRARTPISRES